MPRPSFTQVHVPQFKGTAGFLAHKIRRDEFFDKITLRFPIYSRLPEHWRVQYETPRPEINQIPMKGTRRPQHAGFWTRNEEGNPIPVKNYKLNTEFPSHVKEGLWGGEGIVTGLRHPRGLKTKPVYNRSWRPITFTRKFWSEVLEKEIETKVTDRTLTLIDEAYGFDNYILKTPEYELCSTLGSNLKREMLLRLLNKDAEMYRHDAETREKIYDRYKKFMVPKEEAEWVGLTLFEAMQKQWNNEKEMGLHDSKSLLDVYTKELKTKLAAEQAEKLRLEEGSDVDHKPPIFEAHGDK